MTADIFWSLFERTIPRELRRLVCDLSWWAMDDPMRGPVYRLGSLDDAELDLLREAVRQGDQAMIAYIMMCIGGPRLVLRVIESGYARGLRDVLDGADKPSMDARSYSCLEARGLLQAARIMESVAESIFVGGWPVVQPETQMFRGVWSGTASSPPKIGKTGLRPGVFVDLASRGRYQDLLTLMYVYTGASMDLGLTIYDLARPYSILVGLPSNLAHLPLRSFKGKTVWSQMSESVLQSAGGVCRNETGLAPCTIMFPSLDPDKQAAHIRLLGENLEGNRSYPFGEWNLASTVYDIYRYLLCGMWHLDVSPGGLDRLLRWLKPYLGISLESGWGALESRSPGAILSGAIGDVASSSGISAYRVASLMGTALGHAAHLLVMRPYHFRDGRRAVTLPVDGIVDVFRFATSSRRWREDHGADGPSSISVMSAVRETLLTSLLMMPGMEGGSGGAVDSVADRRSISYACGVARSKGVLNGDDSGIVVITVAPVVSEHSGPALAVTMRAYRPYAPLPHSSAVDSAVDQGRWMDYPGSFRLVATSGSLLFACGEPELGLLNFPYGSCYVPVLEV